MASNGTAGLKARDGQGVKRKDLSSTQKKLFDKLKRSGRMRESVGKGIVFTAKGKKAIASGEL